LDNKYTKQTKQNKHHTHAKQNKKKNAKSRARNPDQQIRNDKVGKAVIGRMEWHLI